MYNLVFVVFVVTGVVVMARAVVVVRVVHVVVRRTAG
jgi:hypothetical protein